MTRSDVLLFETHTHTPLCQHAVGSPEEYAEAAWQRGIRGLLVTCHNPMPNGFSPRVRMAIDQFGEYIEMVQRAREAYAGRVDVRLGLECDFFPGYEHWLERQLASAEFHYVLGSVHPHTAEYNARFWNGDALEFQRTYFAQLAQAAETRLFDCISHPDVVKNETPHAWHPPGIMSDICRALDRIAATGVAMEVNTSGVHKIIPEMNPCAEILTEMQSRSIPVVIGSDAHEPDRVGDGLAAAMDLLKDCGYRRVSYYLDRRRRDVSLPEARRNLHE